MKTIMRSWLGNLQRALKRPPVLLALETMTLERVWGDRFHTTASHELVHVLQGRARIEYRERSFAVEPGDTFIIPQGTAHRDVRTEGNSYRVLYTFFQWPGANSVIKSMDPAVLCAIPAGAKSQFHAKMKEMEGEYLGEAPGARQRMGVILMEILLALARHSHPPKSPVSDAKRLVALTRRRRLAAEVRQYLEQNHRKAFSLEELAAHHHVSPFHLCRTFTREFGSSMTDVLTMIRIERAKEMLEAGQLSVKEIARDSGFPDPNYFAKVFRKVTGLSPSEFRLSREKR